MLRSPIQLETFAYFPSPALPPYRAQAFHRGHAVKCSVLFGPVLGLCNNNLSEDADTHIVMWALLSQSIHHGCFLATASPTTMNM